MLMIRLFTVLCKLNGIKFSDREWFGHALKESLSPDQPCPYCSARGFMRPFSHYKRYLVEWNGRFQTSSTITVPRYVCDSCGHTHALLPSCIIPYRSYSLRFLLTVLRAYFIRSCSVERVCAIYGITVSMLYRWLHLFRQQKSLWLGLLEDASVRHSVFIDSMDGAILLDFFSAFRFSFLETLHGTVPEMPSQEYLHPGGIT